MHNTKELKNKYTRYLWAPAMLVGFILTNQSLPLSKKYNNKILKQLFNRNKLKKKQN